MRYQVDLLALGREVMDCRHALEDGACRSELADVSDGLYRHGPEMSFVGEDYGQPGLPRILFTRLNPTWNKDVGWFGTRESVEEFLSAHPDATPDAVFRHYLTEWEHGHKLFRGMQDAGTVTGHPNKSRRSGEDKRGDPRYGIQLIMEEMIRAGVFPAGGSSSLRFCAINNLVKCAGKRGKSNPGGAMYKHCNYYLRELEILSPHILVAFGGKTDSHLRSKLGNRFGRQGNQSMITLSHGDPCRYFPFLHPLGQGKNRWCGNDVRHLRPSPEIARELGLREQLQFKAGKKGSSTDVLFRYTLHLVSETKRLKEGLDFVAAE